MISNENAVNQLGSWMQNELVENERKGDWREFKDIDSIVNEINYHHQKVVNLLTDRNNLNLDKLKENIADTCNCYLFLANAASLIKTNMRDLSELSNNELKALSHVHNAIYFDDSSDYRTALFEAMCALLNAGDNDNEDEVSDFPSSQNFQRISDEMEKRGL